MPAFKNHSRLLQHFETNELRLSNLRMPQAFDQWNDAHKQLKKDNPQMPDLDPVEDSISIVTDAKGRPHGYIVRKGKAWYVTESGAVPRPNTSQKLAMAFAQGRKEKRK